MPITVRHDVPIAASAGLAALAGTAQAQIREREEARVRGRLTMQLDSQAQRQHAQIQAAAEGQQRQIEAASAQQHENAELAKDRIAYQAGLSQELSEQKFLQEMEGMEERARTEANQWEFKMDTAAQKRQNEYRSVLSYLNSTEAAERFDANELESLRKEATFGLYNTPLSQYHKEPDVLNDGLPEEQHNGTLFRHESGAWGMWKIDRSSGRRFFDTAIKFSETPEGIQQANVQKRDTEIMKGVLDYAKEEIQDGVDKKGIPKTRRPSPEEIRGYMENIQAAFAPATPTKQIARNVAQSTEWDVVRSFARRFKTQIKFNADEQAMPESVAVSSSLLRLAKRRGDNWLGMGGHRQAVQAAYQILKSYNEAQQIEIGM